METARTAVMQDLLHALMNSRTHLDNLRMMGGEDGLAELRVVLDRKIEELQRLCHEKRA
jgi:hypothetical protein